MLTRSILFLAAVSAFAQTYEVRGSVTEAGAGGIAEVKVQVLHIEDGATKTTTTDAQGAFRITVDQPGVYMASAAKDGYSGTGQIAQPIALDAARREATVNITFVRVGEINGRVVDEETREAIAGVPISIFTKQWSFGQLNLGAANREPAITDAEGRFRIQGVRPGEYIASARDRTINIQPVEKFTKADLDKTDDAFPATYWPGGSDAATAFGATLTSGGYADLGTILARKATQYRVHVTMTGPCAEGESVRVWILKRNGGRAPSVGSHPCSGELLLRGFESGSYVLYASSEQRNGKLDTTVSGATSIEVVDKNLNATLSLQRNVVIEGQLIVPEGVTQRFLPRITARPFDLLPGAQTDLETSIAWAPDQRHFQLAVSPRTVSLLVGENAGTYVKEIRYNGTPLRGSTLPINPGVATHKLEITVDDKFGSVAVSVTDGSRGVQGSVFLVKELTRIDDLPVLGFFSRQTGADGTLPATQLAPGDYRVIAVADAQKIHEPGVLERALSTGQRVTVSPGGTQTVTIRVTDLR
jgi:hypothetical protein